MADGCEVKFRVTSARAVWEAVSMPANFTPDKLDRELMRGDLCGIQTPRVQTDTPLQFQKSAVCAKTIE